MQVEFEHLTCLPIAVRGTYPCVSHIGQITRTGRDFVRFGEQAIARRA